MEVPVELMNLTQDAYTLRSLSSRSTPSQAGIRPEVYINSRILCFPADVYLPTAIFSVIMIHESGHAICFQR